MISMVKDRFQEVNKSVFTLVVLLLAGTFVGCSDHGDPVGVVDPPVGVDPVSFAADIQPIFEMSCIGCHGAGGNAGLDLRSGLSYGNLVGVPATASGGNRVEVGNAEASVLYQRLSGTGLSPMPPAGVLPATVQELVAQWINEGARDN